MSNAKLLVLLPILMLVGMGLMLTLRDGMEESVGGRKIKQFGSNLARTILTTGGWLAGMAFLQQLAGFRVYYGW
ncbi:hypothetical protein EP7_003754 [Isosphaeraceae bacterium EP7]